jgi:hypothetical protein
MKALSVREPWVGMIARGEKTIETRTWRAPTYLWNESLLLVGSKQPGGYMYSGKAACVVRVVDCHPMGVADEDAACCKVYDGAFSWVLSDIQKVKLVPVRGRLGIYEVANELVQVVGSVKYAERIRIERSQLKLDLTGGG